MATKLPDAAKESLWREAPPDLRLLCGAGATATRGASGDGGDLARDRPEFNAPQDIEQESEPGGKGRFKMLCATPRSSIAPVPG